MDECMLGNDSLMADQKQSGLRGRLGTMGTQLLMHPILAIHSVKVYYECRILSQSVQEWSASRIHSLANRKLPGCSARKQCSLPFSFSIFVTRIKFSPESQMFVYLFQSH